MSLHINQENTRSKLQEKIAADLREKAIRNSLDGGEKSGGDASNIENSAYLEGSKETTGLAFVWFLVFVATVIAIFYYLIFTAR